MIGDELKNALRHVIISDHARKQYNADASPREESIETLVRECTTIHRKERDTLVLKNGDWFFWYKPRDGKIVTCMHKNSSRNSGSDAYIT